MTKPSGIKTVKVDNKPAREKRASAGKVTQVDLAQTPVVPEDVKIVEQPVEKEMSQEEAKAILDAIPEEPTPVIPEVLAEAIGETASEQPKAETKPVKEKKQTKPKEVKVKVIPTSGILTNVKYYVEQDPDMSIEKSKDGPNQFFVLYKAIKVLYISPNFVAIRPEDADNIGLVYDKKGYHHPFKAKLAIDQGSHATTLLDMLKTMYPKVEKPKSVNPEKEEKKKEVPAEEKPEEVKVS